MTEDELKSAFETRRPALRALGDWVTSFVKESLAAQLPPEAVKKFLQIPPEPRVKETDSFLEKALIRKRKDDPLKEITDQVGVRFVVLLLEDIATIGEIIKAGPWRAQKDRDFQEERLAKPDFFAYQSDHYVVWTVGEKVHEGVTIPDGLACEVQIRTILQHAYAEMAHSSSYKPPVRLPEEDQRHVNRSLAKGSALVEMTDDVFGEIKKKLSDYNESLEILLSTAAEIYTEATGEPSGVTPVAQLIASTYRGLLKDVRPEHLKAWAGKKARFFEQVKRKREASVFYRDPVVVLLGMLIADNEVSIPREWPVDATYLEDLYTTLGISTEGVM